jgi:hypothetical protein
MQIFHIIFQDYSPVDNAKISFEIVAIYSKSGYLFRTVAEKLALLESNVTGPGPTSLSWRVERLSIRVSSAETTLQALPTKNIASMNSAVQSSVNELSARIAAAEQLQNQTKMLEHAFTARLERLERSQTTGKLEASSVTASTPISTSTPVTSNIVLEVASENTVDHPPGISPEEVRDICADVVQDAIHEYSHRWESNNNYNYNITNSPEIDTGMKEAHSDMLRDIKDLKTGLLVGMEGKHAKVLLFHTRN